MIRDHNADLKPAAPAPHSLILIASIQLPERELLSEKKEKNHIWRFTTGVAVESEPWNSPPLDVQAWDLRGRSAGSEGVKRIEPA